ncbi:MAG TPA: hypothetical protein PLK02_04150, partial [Paludibacteraceae bacterium]|nr:hypothetical protein [Paludibacteraceae bacterium]
MKKRLIIILFLIISKALVAIANEEVVKKSSQWENYFTPSVGIELIKFRDLATSPLFYSGAGINGNISWLWIHPKNETYTELSITSANTAAYMPLS